jgi:hypothetical protein
VTSAPFRVTVSGWSGGSPRTATSTSPPETVSGIVESVISSNSFAPSAGVRSVWKSASTSAAPAGPAPSASAQIAAVSAAIA